MDHHRKTFRRWNPGEGAQQAYVPQEVLPKDDLVYFMMDIIPSMDLSPFYNYYERELRGQPPFDVRMMVTLLVYAYAIGVFSSRKIAAACERNLAFRVIVGNDPPDFRTISDFRKIHLDRLRQLFVEVLRVAGEAGMVRLGNLATDGSKIEANASRHKAMSYGYTKKELDRLEAEVARVLEQADRVDAEQDAALGSCRGDELPEGLRRREDRLENIRQAKARLEAEARARLEEERRQRQGQETFRQAEGTAGGHQPPSPTGPTPDDKAQTNFTDPDAKIMKRSNKGFDYCYNAQLVVDRAHEILVAAKVAAEANNKRQAVLGRLLY